MSKFHIKVTDLQSTPVVVATDVGEDIEGLVATRKANGGDMDASFGLVANSRWRETPPPWLRKFYRIDIADAEGVWWRGWIDDIGINFSGRDVRWSAHCMGIGALADDQAYAAENFSGLLTSTGIANVITDLIPGTVTTDITASGHTLSGATAINFSGKARDALNWFAAFGNSSDVLYDWDFRPHYDGSVIFVAGPRSSVPQYYLYLRTLDGWRFKSWGAGYFNRIRVWYNAEASWRDVDDTDEQAAESTGVGRVRTLEVFFPEITQTADVDQVGQVILAITTQTRMIPDAPFRLVGNSAHVLNEYSERVPLHRIRPGKLVSITDLPPNDGARGTLDFLNSFWIKATRYIEDEQAVEIIPESMENALQPIVATSQNLLNGRHRL